jgi:hypothetical protein
MIANRFAIQHFRQTTVSDAEFQIEVNEFLRQTVNLALPAGDLLPSFSLFAIGVLSLVRQS